MRTKHVLVGLVVAATAAAGVQIACRDASSVAPKVAVTAKPTTRTPIKRPKHEADSRSRHAGIHRAGPVELAARNRIAAAEAVKMRRHDKPSAVATTWVSLGPTDAPKEFNYFTIASVDSGRPTSIVVDPRDANVVYLATSGGGMWKTYNFLAAAGPTWSPTTDTLPNLAVGALAIDPMHPDTLYLGSGDFIDGSGNTIFKSIDGGGTWSAPIELAGAYPSATPIPAKVQSIRQIATDGTVVMVATDVGLFESKDNGATFALVDLPEAQGVIAEALWSVASIGGGGWIAGGMAGCDVGAPPPGIFGNDPNPNYCPLGNNAAMWRTDDGVTWTRVDSLPPSGTGRTTLAVGPTSNPATTVVYAFVGDTFGYNTRGFFRSTDGGRTFTDATGTLANPTLDSNHDTSCNDLNVGHDQTWYNQAIVVDPTNADHVLVGGNLCGMRTMNGTSSTPSWELVSHWLPGTGYGETAGGRLPYVHADWHVGASVFVNGTVRTFAGTDGGIFSSTNLFDPATSAENVVWKHHNRGLATHLFYSVVSGDPVTGNPFVLFGGLQDNGTRFRADPATPSAFNQNIGGDGIGGTLHVASSGTTYWASVEYGWTFCKPAETDCSVEQPEAMAEEDLHWHSMVSPQGMEMEEVIEHAEERKKLLGDSDPFYVHYANVETDTVGQSVLTHTDRQVFVAVPNGASFDWHSISQDLSADPDNGGIANVTASRTTVGLYGAVGFSPNAPFYVTTAGNTKTDWTAAKAVRTGALGGILTSPSSIDFPPGGTGQEFVGAFTGTLGDQDRTPPPDDKGRLWRTTDGGQTWKSIVGADPAHRLPNVPVYVVKYDPMVATTIYAGTDLGVYFTTDDAATWNRMGDGLPMVPVRDMYIAKNQDFIRVATYGRGLWEIYPSADANHGSPGNGDYDRNLRLDWVDLAAMSSRLGVTPATATAPLYSWIMDITGVGTDPPRQSIDTADLAALLAKFGDHP